MQEPADQEAVTGGPAPARRSHVRRYIYGGLSAAAAVAIGLVVIFMLGGKSSVGGDKRAFQNAGTGTVPTATVSILSEGGGGIVGSEGPDFVHQTQTDGGYTITTTVKIEGLAGQHDETTAAADAATPVEGTVTSDATAVTTTTTTTTPAEEAATAVTTTTLAASTAAVAAAATEAPEKEPVVTPPEEVASVTGTASDVVVATADQVPGIETVGPTLDAAPHEDDDDDDAWPTGTIDHAPPIINQPTKDDDDDDWVGDHAGAPVDSIPTTATADMALGSNPIPTTATADAVADSITAAAAEAAADSILTTTTTTTTTTTATTATTSDAVADAAIGTFTQQNAASFAAALGSKSASIGDPLSAAAQPQPAAPVNQAADVQPAVPINMVTEEAVQLSPPCPASPTDALAPTPDAPPSEPTTTVTPVTPAAPAAPKAAEGTFTSGNSKTFSQALKDKSTVFGDPLQAAALLKDSQKQLEDYVGTAACWPQDADELVSAIEEQDCPLVVLTNADPEAYALEADIQVTRYVRVMGNPATLPTVDASGARRAFTVGPGGFLELSFVRTKQGGGTTRDRYNLEGPDSPSQVVEVRGGAVAVEPGALGANFVGVVFLAVANRPESVQNAITATLNFVGGRVYGGHVFVAAGNVNFSGCHFWDTTLILPLTDQLAIGGDVLVVGGSVFFAGCAFTVTRLFGGPAGLGLNVAVLGGTMVMTHCVVQSQSVVQRTTGAGHALFVAGATAILTSVDFRFTVAALESTGAGDVFVGDGHLILTGITIDNAYPIMTAYGAGQRLAIGGGVGIEAGVSYTQGHAAAHQSLTGASVFVADGSSLHMGVPQTLSGTSTLFTGQGGLAYNAAGYSMWLGCPLAVFHATLAFYGLGGITAQPAGCMVYIGNPTFAPTALSSFVGAGVVMFLGAGGAVVGQSPVYAPSFVFGAAATSGSAGANYYVNGNQDCDPGIGYFDKSGRYSYFYDKTNKKKEEKNKSARRLSDEEALDLAVEQLRQGRRLSASNVHSMIQTFAHDDAFGPTRFIGANLAYKSNVDLSKAADFDGWVPPAMLDAARDIQAMKTKFPAPAPAAGVQRGLQLSNSIVTVTDAAQANLMAFGQEDRAMVGMESPDVEYCAVCPSEYATVVGNSADQCATFEACEAFVAVAPDGTGAAFAFDGVSYEPWYVVQGEMNPASDRAIDLHTFREGLRAFFVANETTGVYVTAYSMAPDALFQEMLPNLPGMPASAAADSFNPVSTPMKVVFSSNDKAKTEAIQSALENPDSDKHDNLLLFLQDYMATAEDVSLKALDSRWERNIHVPAYNTGAFFRAFAREATWAAGTNAVRLFMPGKEGVPLSHAVRGETYTVQLANFPRATDLTVQLIGSQDVMEAGRVVSKQTATLVGVVKTDKNGEAALSLPVAAEPGYYYLKAVDATGAVFGMSAAIEVVPTARRRLYGPSLVL